MPLLTAIIGVGIGITGITALTGFVELSSVTPALAICSASRSASTTRCSSSPATGTSCATGRAREEAAGARRRHRRLRRRLRRPDRGHRPGRPRRRRHPVPDRDGPGRRRHGRRRRPRSRSPCCPRCSASPAAGVAPRRSSRARARPRRRGRATAPRPTGARWAALVARFRSPCSLLGVLAGLGVARRPGRRSMRARPARRRHRAGRRPASAGLRPALARASAPASTARSSSSSTRRTPRPGAAVDAAVATVGGARRDARRRPAGHRRHAAASGGSAALDDRSLITVIPTSGPPTQATKDLVHDAPRPACRRCRGETGADAVRHRPDRGRHRRLRRAHRRAARLPASWSSGWPSCCCCWCSARSWCRSRRPSASCCRSAPRSARPSRSSSGAGSSGLLGVDADRPDRQHPADPADRHPVRAGHGLRGLPRHPDARGVRPRRAGRARPSSPASGTAPGSSRPPRIIMIGVFAGFVTRRRPDHQDDRLRPGRRRARRRLRGPDDDRAGRDACSARRVVAAALAGPAPARPRHRGRGPRPPARPVGRRRRRSCARPDADLTDGSRPGRATYRLRCWTT